MEGGGLAHLRMTQNITLMDGNRWLTQQETGVSDTTILMKADIFLPNTTTPDGRQVNENGEYVVNGVVQTTSTDDDLPGFENAKKAIITDTSVDSSMRTDVTGWKQFEDGTWKYGYKGQWVHDGVYWISCTYPGSTEVMMECYSFDSNGVMRANTKLGSRSYNSDGKWVKDGEVVSVNAPRPVDMLPDMEMSKALTERGETEIVDWLYSGGPKPSEDSSADNSSSGGIYSDPDVPLWHKVNVARDMNKIFSKYID